MKGRHLLVCGTAIGLVAILAAANPALAQDVASTPPPQENATSKAQDGDIVVTGLRASLRSAQELKRNSDSIVDAIVAEDIGKLPDNNASEALARITGVQVGRYNDEANQVLIRGLPDVTTTFNGRELFTAENRFVQLQDFPAGALAALEVYKSSTSDLIEPGLAGLVNVRSRRPFDFKGFEIAGNIRGSYNEQSDKVDPIGNLLITDRWDTGIGEIGALLNFAYTQSQYRNAVRYNESNIVTPEQQGVTVATPGVGDDFRFPDSVGNYYSRGKRWRPSINGSLQWRPNEALEVYVDGLWQAYRAEQSNEWFNVNLARADRDGVRPTLSNVVLVEGEENKAASLTKTGGYPAEMYRSTNNDRTDTYQGAIGFIWKMDRARLKSDFAYTHSVYTARENSLDSQFASAPTVNVEFDNNGSSSFDLGDFDALDPANYVWRGFYDKQYRAEGDGIQWRTDLELDTDLNWLPRLDFGFRLTDRTGSLRQGNRYAYTPDLNIPLGSLPSGELEVVTDGFRGAEQRFKNWLMPSRAAIRDNFEALRQLSVASLEQLVAANPGDQGYADQLQRWRQAEVPMDPLGGFTAKEASYSAYAQAHYDFALGGIEIDGTFGVRIVNTDGAYSGNSRVVDPDGVATIIAQTNRQNYVDVLPSFGARIRFTPELQMRLGYTHTRTRPSFSQLNPSLNITLNDMSGGGGSSDIYDAFGSGGNPNLQPLTSKNYDATLEYYFAENGSASVAVFYRDLYGFISNYTRDVQDPIYGLIELNRPENAGAGEIKGVEAAFQTFFDFLPGWLSGFGVQANVTYLDGKNALPSVLGTDAPFVRIPGVSEWTYNLTAFYERGPISTRLSYNRRSDYVNSYNRNANEDQYAGEATRAITRLDYSLAYNFAENLTFTVDVNNILAQPFRNYRYYNETQYFPRDVREEGRYYSAGLRFRF